MNIPYPPDYGGMIDSFFRIRALCRLGIKIHLHCFEYGKPHSSELEDLCTSVSYYSRKTGLINHLSKFPFIVSSRRSSALLTKLLEDDYPILFDGLHTTYFLNHSKLAGRRKIVRVHNIEHRYYRNLAAVEKNPFRNLFYRTESMKLALFEKVLRNADRLLSISPSDHGYFNAMYGNSVLIPPFHPFDKVESIAGSGRYILFHGDLSVNLNRVMAEMLISDVFSNIDFPCIIAGRKPPPGISRKASAYKNITIIANPDQAEMSELIREAHINLIPSLSPEGMKLRLLFALFSGRHCIANSITAGKTGLESLCQIADTPADMTLKISILMNKLFTEEIIVERQKILSQKYDNQKNGEKLAGMI